MDKLDLILFVMGGYAVLNLTLMLLIWNTITNRLDKIDSTISDLDRRVSRIEGVLSTKEWCAIKSSDQLKKAE